jgi:hypothetical protein
MRKPAVLISVLFAIAIVIGLSSGWVSADPPAGYSCPGDNSSCYSQYVFLQCCRYQSSIDPPAFEAAQVYNKALSVCTNGPLVGCPTADFYCTAQLRTHMYDDWVANCNQPLLPVNVTCVDAIQVCGGGGAGGE